MYKIVAGKDADKTLIVILKPEDLRLCREKPCDDMIRIDGLTFDRPDLAVIITYAANRNQARSLTRQVGVKIPTSEPMIDYFFSGTMGHKKLIGYIMSEQTAHRLETSPMQEFTVIGGAQYGVDDFSLMILYTVADKPVVDLLRSLGYGLEKIAGDPALAELWRQYGTEVVANYEILLRNAGIKMNPGDAPVEFKLGTYQEGMNEQTLLAVRGDELAWFAANPGETEYFRRIVPGEWPADVKAEWVKVMTTNQPGVRLRTPMTRQADGSFVEWKG